LVLSNESAILKTLSLEKYGGLKEDAIQQIAIATSLQGFAILSHLYSLLGLSLRGCFCVSDSTIQIISQGITSGISF
jgi:hypothetical protein